MKKYGFNSGIIGSDQRSAATGVISQQKFALERSQDRLKPANTVKWSTADLSIIWDVTDDASFPNNGGTTLYDLSGNGNDYGAFSGPTVVTNEGKTFFRTDGVNDYFDKLNDFPAGQPIGDESGTVFFVLKTTDIQGVFLGTSAYLGAYRTGNGFYNTGYGSPTYHQDTQQYTSIRDNLPDGEWHYVEFKYVANTAVGGTNWRLFDYSTYEITCDIRAFGIYKKVLSTEESTQNYDYFNKNGYLSGS